MPFEYVDNLDAIKNVLNDNNTTTSTVDLSADLTVRVKSIVTGDPEIERPTLRGDLLPQIYVRIANKDEEFGTLGSPGPAAKNSTKEATVLYDIIAFMGKEGWHKAHSDVMEDAYNMARNIEGVFQKEFRASGTAMWVNPVRTDFLGPFDIDGSVVKVVMVQLEAKYICR